MECFKCGQLFNEPVVHPQPWGSMIEIPQTLGPLEKPEDALCPKCKKAADRLKREKVNYLMQYGTSFFRPEALGVLKAALKRFFGKMMGGDSEAPNDKYFKEKWQNFLLDEILPEEERRKNPSRGGEEK